jgi:class 3 adenylate cyclase/TolB-like protein
MENDKDNRPEKGDSLSELLLKRMELDERVESTHSKTLTVMFTDIQGSTEFYQKYGDISGRTLLEKHDRILQSILSEYNGRIIKSVGDGTLAVFDLPQDGVRSAIEMQNRLLDANAGKSKEKKLNVRIGLNFGKVLEDQDDVFGLAVSIAARINTVAKAGQILISDSVYEKINKSGNFICRAIEAVKVKGVDHALQLHEVIWSNKEQLEKRKVFVLEIARESRKIKVSGYERASSEQKTVEHYKEVNIDEQTIRKYNAEVISLLNNAGQKGKIDKDILQRLKTAGQLLYDAIFSVELKQKLSATTAEDLILKIDDHLVNIPWEMLYDGNSFLCIRFNMGRLVKTRQNIPEAVQRNINLPLKMLILSDPQGNLKSAYKEGYIIRDQMEQVPDIVRVNIKSSSVTSGYVQGELRNYDIVHYAGHADYNVENPSESGFLLEDSSLSASNIRDMVGQKPLPSLVFSNACKSGHTDSWRVEEEYGEEIYGLANAFLLAGVRHYIGTFWDIQDEPGQHFALEFYRELMSGAMVGEALRKARLGLMARYGEENIIWSSYMLYGDPTMRYADLLVADPIAAKEEITKEEKEESAEAAALAGSTRSAEEVVVFPQKKHRWMIISALLTLILTAVVFFQFVKNREDITQFETVTDISHETKAEKKKRIDELVTALLTNYAEAQKTGNSKAMDSPKSSLPTIVFLNVKPYGITEQELEFILLGITNELQRSKRMHVVEREVLDALLEELKLSSSQLANRATALKVGEILSANFITIGSIFRDGQDWQVSLRLIETETTIIKVALAESIHEKEKNVVAESIGQTLLKRMTEEYPALPLPDE